MKVDITSKNFHVLDTDDLAKHLAGNETHLVSVLAEAETTIETHRVKILQLERRLQEFSEALATRRAEFEELEAFATALKRGLAKRLVRLLVEDEPQDGCAS